MRFRRTLIYTALALAALALSSSAGAAPVPMCSGPGDSRCVETIRQNGATPVDLYNLVGIRNGTGADAEYLIEIQSEPGPPYYALDPADVWTVVLNTGGTAPEELVAIGRDLDVGRGMSGGHHTISIAMHPVRKATRNSCDASGCGGPGALADEIHPGYWRMDVRELGYLSDSDDRAAMRNYHFATSADWSSTPPQLDPATNTITADVANAHFESPGVRYIGSAEFRLPKPMLTRIYGVDDPDSLTASSFRASSSGSGPDPTTTVVIDAFSVTVQIDGIRFSKRKLSVRGKTWPRVPRDLRAKRKSSLKGVIRTDGARPRGSKVRGYKAVCRTRNGPAVRAETRRRNKLPIRVRGLEPGKRYVCTVRAKSKAGLGVRGKVRMPRRP